MRSINTFKVRLTKVESTHNIFRTDVVEGVTQLDYPVPGELFVMFSESLTDPEKIRFVQTSPIKEVVTDGSSYLFKTVNSTYRLEYL
jgi:hypothetical protein